MGGARRRLHILGSEEEARAGAAAGSGAQRSGGRRRTRGSSSGSSPAAAAAAAAVSARPPAVHPPSLPPRGSPTSLLVAPLAASCSLLFSLILKRRDPAPRTNHRHHGERGECRESWGRGRGEPRRPGRKSGGRPQPAGGGGGGSAAPGAGTAARLKRRRTWEMEGAQQWGTAGGVRERWGDGGRTRERGCGPPIPSAPWPGAPGSGAGSHRAGRRANGRRAAPGRSRPPAASPSPLPSLHPPSPPISRLPLSLRPPCPEARRAPPLPLGRAAGLLPAAVPAAARGDCRGFRRGGGHGVRGSLSWRRWSLASFPQRRPPSPKGKNWLPRTVEPVVRAGASKGVPSPALRWPLRYTSETFTGTLSTNTGCARGNWSGEGYVDVFGDGQAGRRRPLGTINTKKDWRLRTSRRW